MGCPLIKLHRVVMSSTITANSIYRHDIIVMQLCGGLSFLSKSLQSRSSSDAANGKTFNATGLPNDSCVASYTTPIPPRPISRMIRKSPRGCESNAAGAAEGGFELRCNVKAKSIPSRHFRSLLSDQGTSHGSPFDRVIGLILSQKRYLRDTSKIRGVASMVAN